MGLFDRLFGKKEEPKIEDIVKEALENLDLSEEVEENQTAVKETSQEETETDKVEETPAQGEISQVSTEEVIEPEAVEKTAQEELELESDELEQLQEPEEILEEESQETVETEEELASEVVEEEYPQVEETVQEKYDRSLKKTRTGFGARLNAFFANFRSVDEEFFEELEELLIMSDVGVQVASNLTEELRYEAKLENAKKPDALRRVIIEKLVELYEKDGNYDEQIHFQDGLTVMLFVGVNGVGKTTSIGKLAHRYKQAGKKVMLVAADTFRAGAVAQLAEWGRRVDVPVVTGPEKADPASVVFDGMERAVAEGIDILMIDTAGRLQNKDNLMAELEKIGRIIKRVVPEAPHETFLALDASTGQNALVQAKEFSKITPLTGIVLTKIDGTARGGVVLAIREELNIPVKLIGFGEKIDDIGEFNSENFMKGLLEGLI
ncbi:MULTISPECIES: signal recognition particle-docking protein FtsY [Streptococcus]|uniref:Signal recognition particle receptor FtsY n=2 Tax=Streptococcus oralis TaxID=1303 RepID=A0A1X1J8D4_STROR|nr:MULTISPECIES: signal recognition particle-docking protein FtsY [Streptococcus]RSI89389.1 Signal recognition particle receptor FtsY [Streptococcus mitis]EFA24636.1 signal recognition particle-docking protein FtsY [Streptococcus sp. M143]MCY7090774.1 signal recognition particle-docking protein FtsY [Streptococcus oralis]ORO81586.1 signal recognition particle-docking protein FtsY [Streptococcus oralis subsp. dentisani]ORO84078.1 signal recognition particle-docking protein FtsY [Streptococcus o